MPMQYPPLADGTYRYGDDPRPLPSPAPGPDAEEASSRGGGQFSPAPHPATALQFAPTPHEGAPHESTLHQGTPRPAAPPRPGSPTHPARPHPEGAPGYPGPPAQSDQDARKRTRDSLAAAAIVGAAGLVVVVILGLAFLGPGSGPTTPPGGSGPGIPGPPPAPAPAPGGVFAVDGRFTVVSSPGEPVSGDAAGCDLPITLSDIGEGSTIALSRQDGTQLDVSGLTYEGGDLSSCTFTFDFPEVPSGARSYLIELDGRGQLVYSEQELRAGVEITLGR